MPRIWTTEDDGNSVARLNPYGLPRNNMALAISGDVMQNVLLSVEYVIAVMVVLVLVVGVGGGFRPRWFFQALALRLSSISSSSSWSM